MSPVRILSSDLINQIAAGEVVERPASAVKELVENALDACAGAVDIILENGGRKLIEVRDNGSGMSSGDARLAMERHATSKLAEFDDLSRVRTLGFRGEALPSIASVSRFTLLTFDGVSEHATEIVFDPLSGTTTSRPAARDRGTTVTVRELFENVPARRKFLRSADAEFRSIVSIVSSYALPNPQCAFRLEHNGRTVLDFPAAASIEERVIQVLGEQARDGLAAIEGERESASVRGYVTRQLRFGSRRNQFFFVNGRLVRDRVLAHAASRACEAFDFEGHPAIALFFEIAPDRVDVNVHPAKTEVRFRDSGLVHVLVEQAVKRALGGPEEGSGLLSQSAPLSTGRESTAPFFPGGGALPGATVADGGNADALRATQRSFIPPAPLAGPRVPLEDFTPLFRERAAMVQPPLPGAVTAVEEPVSPQLGDLRGRVIGQYRLSYILVDTPGGLRLIDQHVAHERVLYDRFRAAGGSGGPSSQRLLAPHIYEAGAAEIAALESHLDELRHVGFEIERFSGKAFAISAIPAELLRHDLDGFFRKLLDASAEEKSPHLQRIRDKVCASLACQAAIKVHRSLTGEEMASLVGLVLDSSNPYACPHGRPIIVDIRHLDIEKHFHRK